MLAQLILITTYFILSLFFSDNWSYMGYNSIVLPSWQLFIALLIGLVIIVAISFGVQRRVDGLFERDQMLLETMYNTKLGMWSPK